MKKNLILIGILVFVSFLVGLWVKETFACNNTQTSIKYGNTEYCYDKGSYSDESSKYPTLKSCTIAGPNNVQAYYLTNFSQPTWKFVKNSAPLTRKCYPYSLKVT